jgi:hypothetical protein
MKLKTGTSKNTALFVIKSIVGEIWKLEMGITRIQIKAATKRLVSHLVCLVFLLLIIVARNKIVREIMEITVDIVVSII